MRTACQDPIIPCFRRPYLAFKLTIHTTISLFHHNRVGGFSSLHIPFFVYSCMHLTVSHNPGKHSFLFSGNSGSQTSKRSQNGLCRFEAQLTITAAGQYSLTLLLEGAVVREWSLEVVADSPLLQNTKLVLPEIPVFAGQPASFAFLLEDAWGNFVSEASSLDLNGTTLEGPSTLSASAGDIRCFSADDMQMPCHGFWSMRILPQR